MNIAVFLQELQHFAIYIYISFIEWFWHWLTTEYIVSEPEGDILDQYNNFMDYASKKIAYMKRGTNPVPKSISKKRGKNYSFIASFKIILVLFITLYLF